MGRNVCRTIAYENIKMIPNIEGETSFTLRQLLRFISFQLYGHWDLCGKIGSLSLAEHLLEFEPSFEQYLDLLDHSIHSCTCQ